jgi:hypothetical protein
MLEKPEGAVRKKIFQRYCQKIYQTNQTKQNNITPNKAQRNTT